MSKVSQVKQKIVDETLEFRPDSSKFDLETGEQIMDEFGREIPDPVPVAVPAGFRKPETTEEALMRLIRRDREAMAELASEETWEDLHDFDVGDDFDPTTPYETFFDPVIGREVTADEFKKNEDRYRQEVIERQKAYYRLREQEYMAQEAEKPAPRPNRREAAEGAAKAKASSEAPSALDDNVC